MARRATLFSEYRETYGDKLLVLDAGNALFGVSSSLQSEGRVMVEAMNALGYDTMGIARFEFTQGLDVFRAREAEAEYPFLSANLTDLTGQPVGQRQIIIERGGKRIGIFGITDPEVAELPAGQKELVIEDPTTATRAIVDELAPQVDIVIMLSALGIERDKALAEVVPGIDVIIGLGSRIIMKAPERVGDTVVVQQGYLGEWVGKLLLTYDADGTLVDAQEDYVALTPDYADDPALAAMMQEWAERYPEPTPTPLPTTEPE